MNGKDVLHIKNFPQFTDSQNWRVGVVVCTLCE
jgi:hypothetical protein